MAEFRAYE